MDRIPVRLAQEDQDMGLYEEEQAQYARELKRLRENQQPWWRRLGLWLRAER
ncbi:hypothetical protein [Celeribacter sp. SCSIO 80788]|uniref:hypothetical protein n=1 Tax=Celeribacter sp. SCSIO 80788 TaxID=3117013 RepID=UPI003DA33664